MKPITDQEKSKEELITELQDLRRRLSTLKENQQVMDSSHNIWKTLMANTPDLVYFKDTDHGLIQASQAYADAVGENSPAELVGKTAVDLWPKEADEILADERKVLSGEAIIRKERKVTLASGDTCWYLLTKIPIYESGEVVGFFGMDKDITRRKRMETALEESHTRFLTILNSLDAHIYAADMESYQVLFSNKKMQEDFGGNLEGKTCHEIFRDLSSPCPHCSNYELLDEEGQPTGVYTWEDRNPLTKKWYLNYDRAIKWIDGRYVRLQMAFDISARKEMEKALQESEQKLRNIVEYSTNLFYMHTPDHVLTYVSPQCRNFLQCDPEEAKVRWTEFVTDHPVNEKGIATTEKAIRTGKRQPPFELELIGKRGKKIWVEVNEAPLVENGETTAIVGTLTDITQRKEAMRQNKKRRMYLEGVLKAAPDAIITLDAEQRVVEWNPGAHDLFGYTAQEAVGKLLDDLIAREDVLDEARRFTKDVQDGSDLHATETVRYRKDGSPVEVILAGSPIMVDGKMIGAIGVYTDISDRVRMEEALRAMALRDDLTGLYNRRGFTVLAEQHIKVANRDQRRLILLYGDVDNLKDINDNLGHLAGDQALKDIAQAMTSAFRKSDIIARIGGDEFVVLAMEMEQASPSQLTKRLEMELKKANDKSRRSLDVSISIGWSIYDPASPSSLDELLILADKAMYNRKVNSPPP